MCSYILLDVNHKYNHANICVSLVIEKEELFVLKNIICDTHCDKISIV